MLTPLSLTGEKFGTVPRAYIECLHDRAIPHELQRLVVSTLRCRPVISMETDHSPFCSAPEALAAHLVSIAVESEVGG
jgi:hypothetical protein